MSRIKYLKTWQELCSLATEAYGLRHTYPMGMMEFRIGEKEEGWIEEEKVKVPMWIDLRSYHFNLKTKEKEFTIFILANDRRYDIDVQVGKKTRWRLGKEFDFDFSGTLLDFLTEMSKIELKPSKDLDF